MVTKNPTLDAAAFLRGNGIQSGSLERVCKHSGTGKALVESGADRLFIARQLFWNRKKIHCKHFCHASTIESRMVRRDYWVSAWLEPLHSKDTTGCDVSISLPYKLSSFWTTCLGVSNIVNGLVYIVLGFNGELTIRSKEKFKRFEIVLHGVLIQGQYSWIYHELFNICWTAFMRRLDMHSASADDASKITPQARNKISISCSETTPPCAEDQNKFGIKESATQSSYRHLQRLGLERSLLLAEKFCRVDTQLLGLQAPTEFCKRLKSVHSTVKKITLTKQHQYLKHITSSDVLLKQMLWIGEPDTKKKYRASNLNP